MKQVTKLAAVPIAAVVMLTGGALAGYAALADAQIPSDASAVMQNRGPHVHGTIESISGSTLVVTGKDGTTYTVDASNATIKTAAEGGTLTTGSLADLATGDKIGVRGDISGTSVSATEIMEGFMGRGRPGRGHGVMGEVTSVDGSTITITGRDGESYTVSADSATVAKMVEGSLSDIEVGDTIGVQGEVDGLSVSATRIMDDMPEHPIEPEE